MYFITCLETCEVQAPNYLYYGSSKCLGYMEFLYDAVRVLNENKFDMHEGIYNYVVIEKMSQGMYPDVEEEYWFMYDSKSNGFFEIDKPEGINGRDSFAFG